MNGFLQKVYFGLIGLFLSLPIIVVAGVSVNEKQDLAFPPKGFSLGWYGEIFTNVEWRNALFASITLAALSAAVALAIAADTHPIQNLGVLKRIEALAGADAARQWAHDTLVNGLGAVERLIARNPGPFAFGAAPTLADILIVPQLFNARRFGVDLARYPRILAVEAACADLPAFQAAHPDRQPDAD